MLALFVGTMWPIAYILDATTINMPHTCTTKNADANTFSSLLLPSSNTALMNYSTYLAALTNKIEWMMLPTACQDYVALATCYYYPRTTAPCLHQSAKETSQCHCH